MTVAPTHFGVTTWLEAAKCIHIATVASKGPPERSLMLDCVVSNKERSHVWTLPDGAVWWSEQHQCLPSHIAQFAGLSVSGAYQNPRSTCVSWTQPYSYCSVIRSSRYIAAACPSALTTPNGSLEALARGGSSRFVSTISDTLTEFVQHPVNTGRKRRHLDEALNSLVGLSTYLPERIYFA